MISQDLLSLLTGQIKTRANDWAVEGKGGSGGLREGGERGGERVHMMCVCFVIVTVESFRWYHISS